MELFNVCNKELIAIPNTTDMPDTKCEIYFSYAWKKTGEPVQPREWMVNICYESLRREGYTVLCGNNYRQTEDNINDFLKKLDNGNSIVLGLSERYLKSEYCMFEFYEIFHSSKLSKEELKERIFLIQLEALNLSNPKVLTRYFNHWKNVQEEWEDMIDMMLTNMGPAQQTHYDKVKSIVGGLSDLFGMIDSLCTADHTVLTEEDIPETMRGIKAHFERMNLKAILPGRKSDHEVFSEGQINGSNQRQPNEY